MQTITNGGIAYTYHGKLITTAEGGYTISNPDGSDHPTLSGVVHSSKTKVERAIKDITPKISSLTESTTAAATALTATSPKENITMDNGTTTAAPAKEINTITLNDKMAIKDVRALGKTIPKKAKTLRYVIDGEKVARFGKATDLDTLHGLNVVVDFSSAAFAAVVKDNSKFESISLKQVSTDAKTGKVKTAAVPRPNTGFVALIDELLTGQKDSLETATQKILAKFPTKNPKSVRRITSNRVNARRRAALDKDGKLPDGWVRLAWLPAQAKSGVMEAIDAHYATTPAKLSFKEMVTDILTRFPKMGNGEPREFEATSRIMRNRARILRKQNKPTNYVKSAALDSEERAAKKAKREEEKAVKAAERAAKTKAGKEDAKTEKALAAGKVAPAPAAKKPVVTQLTKTGKK